MNRKNAKGFSLIEVLVAFVIAAIGLLGLSTMQLLTIKNVNNTQFRTMATIHAYDMAERMRSNKAGLAQYNGIDTSAADPCSSCSSGSASQADADAWKASLAQSVAAGGLPNAKGTITSDAGIHQITITWDEQIRDASGGNVDNQTYTLTIGL